MLIFKMVHSSFSVCITQEHKTKTENKCYIQVGSEVEFTVNQF